MGKKKLKFKGKILKKPKVKGIKGLSAVKAIDNIAQEQEPLVREVEPRRIEQDDRSLFFKNELIEEKKKWLR